MNYLGVGTSVNYVKAAKYFKEAAFGGLEKGMLLYANCYAFGHGVKIDSTRALFWANRALEKDCYDTYRLLGCMYRDGNAVKKDNYLAKEYFEKGVEHNNEYCMYDLGEGYESGTFVEKDMGKAMEYYLMAANNGNFDAMRSLAKKYDDRNGELYDQHQAAVWYEKLVEGGKEDYIDNLIRVYESVGDYAGVIPLYQKKAENGDVVALKQLAYLYAEGQGVPKDFAQALAYIERAIEAVPDDMEFQDSKGEILLMKGDLKKAKAVYKMINKKQPLFFSKWTKDHGHPSPFYEYMLSLGK